MTINEKIIEIATNNIGLVEIQVNAGWEGVEGAAFKNELQNYVGWRSGDQYCADTCKYWWLKAYEQMNRQDIVDILKKLMSANSVQTFTNLIDYRSTIHNNFIFTKLDEPVMGGLVVWDHFVNGSPTSSGHIGICLDDEINNGQIKTIEANTSINKQGKQGIGIKLRHLTFERFPNDINLLGFIKPINI